MRPFTGNDPVPLVVAAVASMALGAVAIVLAARRDVGSGVLASRDVAPPRSFGLRSATGLAARLQLPVLAAWAGGAAALGIVFGIIAKLTTSSIPESLRNTLDDFGVRGGFAKQYFGVVFLLVAAVVALLPATQVGAACNEETSGRLVHVLSRPTRRATWFAGRLVLCGAAVLATGLLTGFGAWLGAATQGVEVDLATLLGAGLNVVPTALVALGVGAVVLALAPRAAATTVYALVGWSLVVDLLASMVSGARWLEHLSLFHYMALAPGEDPEPLTIVVTVATAIGLCALAVILFDRRDLRSD
jgi:ABC-2 type transport system permease protein